MYGWHCGPEDKFLLPHTRLVLFTVLDGKLTDLVRQLKERKGKESNAEGFQKKNDCCQHVAAGC